jgi:hypothetical protein
MILSPMSYDHTIKTKSLKRQASTLARYEIRIWYCTIEDVEAAGYEIKVWKFVFTFEDI